MYDNRHKTLYTIKSMERGKLYVQYKRRLTMQKSASNEQIALWFFILTSWN
jgi:hypothetical protein